MFQILNGVEGKKRNELETEMRIEITLSLRESLILDIFVHNSWSSLGYSVPTHGAGIMIPVIMNQVFL